MFANRRTVRRKRPRHSLKRRIARKRQIIRPQLQDFIVEKPSFDASGSSLYLWMYVASEVPGSTQRILKEQRKPIVLSLRQICADVIAANPESICSSYLEDSPWTCWRFVWESALRQGMDLPSLFRAFAEKFGSEPSFRCHAEIEGTIGRLHETTADLKHSALLSCLVPTHLKHRIDNVFCNISISDFVHFVSCTANCGLVIDCSKMPLLTVANLVALCKIPNLEAIDLSHNRLVDDQFLYTLNSCLVSQCARISILRVYGCPSVTIKGISALIAADERSMLALIETDVFVKSDSMFSSKLLHSTDEEKYNPIPGTRWKSIIDEQSPLGLLGKHSLATKVNYLLRLTNISRSSHIIWDIKFFNQVAEQSTSIKTFNDIVWRLRLQLGTTMRMSSPYMYIKDPSCKIPMIVKEATVKIQKPNEGSTVSVPRLNGRKPKHVKTDANTFFLGN